MRSLSSETPFCVLFASGECKVHLEGSLIPNCHCILLCSVYSLSEKTTVYATLVGILNAKKYDFGEEVRYHVYKLEI